MDPSSGQLPDDLEAQVANLFGNVVKIVTAAGGSTADIVKLTFFVPDRSARDIINKYWVELFPESEHRPARHTLVQQLAGTMLVQAELLAFVDDSQRG